jgi:delta 1-pyrroline-5-carboxylate dehydrogenase
LNGVSVRSTIHAVIHPNASASTALPAANTSEFALTGGLYSRSPAHIARAKADVICGNLYVNRPITGAIVGRHPFGGFQMSGGGTKAGGRTYLLEFLVPRVVTENRLRQGFAGEGDWPEEAHACGPGADPPPPGRVGSQSETRTGQVL